MSGEAFVCVVGPDVSIDSFAAALTPFTDRRWSIAGDGSRWWVRGPVGGTVGRSVGEDEIDRLAGVLPGPVYRVLDNQLLVRVGQTVASERLPSDLDWMPIDRWVSVQWPVAAIGGGASDVAAVRLSLVDGGSVTEVVAAVFDRATLLGWVDDASEVWLRQLSFVVREDWILVRGERLPPVRGRGYLVDAAGGTGNDGGVWIAAGQRFEPELGELLSDVFHLAVGEVAVVESMRCWSVVTPEDWTTLSRAALRQCRPATSDPKPVIESGDAVDGRGKTPGRRGKTPGRRGKTPGGRG